ncbi:MAG: DNA polymerase III subunit delta [Bacteroidetes bacterium HGW-Bacteroidetes-4]|jgi:DNA polymerase-3 subunit delta'|nr:MAG: DNA polymerase III subunit delta [Bacteroidetes bacterium HGW-Bacteroidetes-4]
MLFADIIGQQVTINHLRHTVKENRISHAQLLLGGEGYGALPLALAFAQYLMCQNRSETDACGTCAACRKVAKYQHPDLHFVFPVIPDKTNDIPVSDKYIAPWRQFILKEPYGTYTEWMAALNAEKTQGLIRAEEGREIIRKLSMKSFEAEYKIMIIWYPEKMNAEAGNKLLKLIEEPPEKTLFFLVAENSEFILNTILSRTQLIKIGRISEDALFVALKNRFQLNDEKARQIARISDGNYVQAKEYINSSVDTQQNYDNFIQMMRLSYAGKIPEMIAWVDEVAKLGRERQKAFLAYSLRMVRENLVLNQKQKQMARLSADETSFAERFSTYIHPANCGLLQQELDKAFMHIARYANAKVVFLDLCFKQNRLLRL